MSDALPPLDRDRAGWRPWLRALRAAGKKPLARALVPLVRPQLVALADPSTFVTNQAGRFLPPADAHAAATAAVDSIEAWASGAVLDAALLEAAHHGLASGRGGAAQRAAAAVRALIEIARGDAFANLAHELALQLIEAGVPREEVESALAVALARKH